MKKLFVLPAVVVLATVATLAASVGARSTDAPAAVVHSHVAGVSDPDPTDCPFCAGNPQVHIRALWAIQKEVARVYQMRLL
ncbi:MAG: hypothetical protein NTY35_00515 [Planctomycetota bacterium]|nr:hypothetical protein [Planctomycetota bacterium]